MAHHRIGGVHPVGETVGIGWMDCYVTDREDGTLGLCEPDFAQYPVTVVPGAANALEQVWFQIEVAKSLRLETPSWTSPTISNRPGPATRRPTPKPH